VRLGLLGGTFDPPHVGHLLAAVDALEALALDRLVLVPSGEQPLKVGEVTATAAQRLAMVRLLVGDQPSLAVDPIEIERGGLSFTVDTLAAYAERHPTAERFFLVGADVLTTFDKWREPERVLRLARLVVLQRAVDGRQPVSVPLAP
jgi:nicotinate-nucleotide adenylyltransferase